MDFSAVTRRDGPFPVVYESFHHVGLPRAVDMACMFYVPATGWSALDLYLMGLAAPPEVPDFFLLKNPVRVGTDPKGFPLYKGERVKVTIENIIASLGPRTPDMAHSQKEFNTGMVALVLHGASPSSGLIERLTAIREKWIEFWTTTTGHRSVMRASPL